MPRWPGLLGEADVVACVGAGRAGDHRHGHGIDDGLEQAELLVDRQCRRLAGGARHDQALVALLDEPLGEGDGGVEVELTLVVERGDHCGEHTTETGHQADPLVVTVGSAGHASLFTIRNLFDPPAPVQFGSERNDPRREPVPSIQAAASQSPASRLRTRPMLRPHRRSDR